MEDGAQFVNKNEKTVSKLMFRLLPAQILIAMISVVNTIVSTFFASNFLGESAMDAVQLYAPIAMLMGSVNLMLSSGATILCGQSMGKGDVETMGRTFSLDIVASCAFAALLTAAVAFGRAYGLAEILSKDPSLRPGFYAYAAGQAAGIVPFFLGSQLSAFLSLENNMKRNMAASVSFIAANVAFNFLFVAKLDMGVFGLAAATAAGLWIFFLVEAQSFARKDCRFKFSLKGIEPRGLKDIFAVGYPGALSNLWQTARGFIVNFLILSYVGASGISAFCAANNLMMLAWCLPAGMVAVSRMVMSVGVGEEDRQTVADVMRVMFKKFCLLNNAVALAIIVLAKPLAYLFYKDSSSDVFMMTVWGFRLLPLCLAFGSILQHFVCYAQSSGKNVFIQLMSFFDGTFFVALWTAILIPAVGMNSVYLANVLNGVCVFASIVLYSCACNRRFPKNMEELMVMPDSFGIPKSERMDLSVRDMQDVALISKAAQDFCLERCVDSRRAFFCALALEEMAGNIVLHGFSKDKKKHSLEIRLAHVGGDLVLRLRDDCVLFNPGERAAVSGSGADGKNVGIKIVYGIAKSVRWQSIFGMNVLTILV